MPPRRKGNRLSRAINFSHLPGWMVPLLAIFGIFTLGLLGAWFFQHVRTTTQQAAQSNSEILVQLDKPLVSQPLSGSDVAASGAIDKDTAKQLLDSWLSAKAKALGQAHQTEALEQILTEPSLSKWRTDAEDMKRTGEYRVYKHDVKIESVEMLPGVAAEIPTDAVAASSSPSPEATASASSEPGKLPPVPTQALSTSPGQPTISATAIVPANPNAESSAKSDQAKVIAQITETTEIFKDGKSEGTSAPEELKVQYNLVRKDGKWRIQDWQIL